MAAALSTRTASPSPSSSDAPSSLHSSETAASTVVGTAPSPGRVNRLRQNWALHEDGALAQRLQSQEIEQHLGGNRMRNHQIREDFPTAFLEQNREELQAQARAEERLRRQRELEERDAAVARAVAGELEARDTEHQRYEALRDEIFARRLQNLEQGKRRPPQPPQPPQPVAGARLKTAAGPPPRPEPQGTPPLPVLSNGDVPEEAGAEPGHARDTSFHDLRGGIRYNDEQYLVKTARPAVVQAEPLYANNKPEHYAVSNAFPSGGAAGGADGAVGGEALTGDGTLGRELLGAAGLSQKDIAVAKKVEAQLEQEKRDRELARQLQQQMSYTDETHADMKAAAEARDLEVAMKIHEKEKAKLRRAKERSRQRKLERQREEQLGPAADGEASASAAHNRSGSGVSNHESRAGSRLSRHSNAEASSAANTTAEASPETLQPKTQHPSSLIAPGHQPSPQGAAATLDESLQLAPPARRPYMNRQAIDHHVSSSGGDANGHGGAASTAAFPAADEEPTYENVRRQTPPSHQHSHIQKKSPMPMQAGPSHHHHNDLPVPPYMPLQQSKKSSSMERRLNRKKEKEGCKQQ